MNDNTFYEWENQYVTPHSMYIMPENIAQLVALVVMTEELPTPQLVICTLDVPWEESTIEDRTSFYSKGEDGRHHLVYRIPRTGNGHPFPVSIVLHELAHMILPEGHTHDVVFGELLIELMIMNQGWKSELTTEGVDSLSWMFMRGEEMMKFAEPALTALRAMENNS